MKKTVSQEQILSLVSASPVSVEEPRPGSLCDLWSRRGPSLSLLTPRPAFSLFPALRRKKSGWPWRSGLLPCPPLCALPAVEDKAGGTVDAETAPWCDGVEGWTRNSGMQDCRWVSETAIASSWEQLLASIAWRRKTGDLQDKNNSFCMKGNGWIMGFNL